MAILAINYRESDDINNTVPGSWKEFTSREAAEMWLKQRARKTKTSPKGMMIFQDRSAIDALMLLKDQQPISLTKALENYLKWKQY